MKIIISPAKKMKQDADSFECHELPQLLHQTEQLYQQLCRMSYTELKRFGAVMTKLQHSITNDCKRWIYIGI